MGERSGGSDMDMPPYSRLFVACGKQHTEEELREVFSEFGEIEALYLVKDNQTKESRGIGFVKFRLASSAALAQEKADRTKIGDDPKPINVCIATSKTQQKSYDVNELSSRNRLYVILPDGSGEQELEQQFSHFEGFESSHVVRNRSAGFVTFAKPSAAAIAMENCEQAYHAVIAEPRDARRSSGHQANGSGLVGSAVRQESGMKALSGRAPLLGSAPPLASAVAPSLPLQLTPVGLPTCLCVRLERAVTQQQVTSLCDAPPGLVACQLAATSGGDPSSSSAGVGSVAYATYQSADAARYALDKLGAVEYPPGFALYVSYASEQQPARRGLLPLESATALPGAYAAGVMPPLHAGPAGLAGGGVSPPGVATRAFFVCTPTPPPLALLRSAFACFGGLEKLWLVGEHNYGYAEFDNAAAALLVIGHLNGTSIGGCKMKVVMAEPRRDQGYESAAKKSRK